MRDMYGASFVGAIWGLVVPPSLLPMGSLGRYPSRDMMGLRYNSVLSAAAEGCET